MKLLNAIVFEILFLVISPVWSAEFHIAEGDIDGLSKAIDEANTNNEPDYIFLAAGTYELIDRFISYFEITSPIVIQGAGSRYTLLKRTSENWFNFFHVDPQGDLTLRDVTLTGGYSGSANECGGAINLVGGRLTIEHSTISNNYSRYSGGAVCSTEGHILVDRSEFVGNETADWGGAILSRQSGFLTIRNSLFERNKASSGGAIYNNKGELVISGSVIVSNSAHSGGGISTDASGNPSDTFVNISTTTVKDNVGELGNGGGLNLHTAQASISKSTISNNTAGRFGGGIYSAFGSMIVANSTISGNQSASHGGGIMAHGESRVELNNLTVAYNVADYDNDGTGDGGGIYNHTGQRAAISNSIFAGNTIANESASECSGPVYSRGFNLVQVSSPGCDLGNFPSNLVDVDPLLEPLVNNGGLTDTHALGLESPAIDAGSPSTCEETDQRGVSRNCDIGAFEVGVLPPDPGFQINAGLNDAWYNPETDGQGFFIIVFPEIRKIFMSWFTYDTKRPSEDVTAILGEPGHRWLTAQGAFADNQASLDVHVTSGGVFDSREPNPTTERDGTLLLEFSSCNRGTVSYNIPSIERHGLVPIQRISLDNVSLCEKLMREIQLVH